MTHVHAKRSNARCVHREADGTVCFTFLDGGPRRCPLTPVSTPGLCPPVIMPVARTDIGSTGAELN